MQNKHIVILGAGFGGIEVAKTLACRVPADTTITIISKKPYFEYYPGLYRVLSSVPPFEVFVPLQFMTPRNVTLVIDEVVKIDPASKQIVYHHGGVLSYDTLVLALGSEAFYFNTPGVETYALACKSLVDVRYLRRDLISKINRVQDDKTKLHVVIAGGGPTGVEMAGQLHALFKDEARFHDIDCAKLQVTIVQADSRLVPQLPEKVSALIKKHLQKIGVEILTETKILEQKEYGIILSNGVIASDTLIWTAGTQMSKVIQSIPGLVLSPRKKVLVNEFLQAQGLTDIYVVGDIADTTYAGLAQTAVSNGAYVGKTIAHTIKGKSLSPYKPAHAPVHVMPVGRFWGVLHYKGLVITGILPHMARYAVDVFYFWRRLSLRHFLTLYIKGKLK